MSEAVGQLRVIFPTQSTGLGLFWRLRQALLSDGGLAACGFFVTNRYEYTVFEREHPDVNGDAVDVLREWDVLADAAKIEAPDLGKIERWEKLIGDPTLWNTLIIDRRMGYTLTAQFRQSYTPAYDHETLLKILQAALDAIAAQFDRIQPHAVIGLNAVTLYDYLYYLMARQRSIPYFQLKLTRVQNYVTLFTDPFAVSPHIADAFRRIMEPSDGDLLDRQALEQARVFLAQAKMRTLVYEGAIKRAGVKEKRAAAPPRKRPLVPRIGAWLQRMRLMSEIRDPHYPTLLQTAYQAKIVRPLRRRLLMPKFDIDNAVEYVRRDQGRYALFPLNTEPEVALLAFGRPFRNQIETVRNVAAALPVGWKLVVKEHPNAFGYRSLRYYRKLKQIPNVFLAGPNADTGQLTDGCGLVVLVYGTIGLEAIIKRKPTIILCETPYGIFSSKMVRFTPNIWRMSHDIRELLDNYEHDEREVEAFLAAHIRTGIRLNLFTELLGKGGRQAGDTSQSLEQQYTELARYSRQRIIEELQRLAQRGSNGHRAN